MANLLLLAEAAHEGAEHHAEVTALGLGPGAWVALSMLTLIAIMLYLKVPSMVGGMLDRKIAGIKEMLDEAVTLRKGAEALKAEFDAKVASAAEHAEQIKAGAETEAKHIIEKAERDAADLIARRERMAEEKIAAAERAAIAELRQRTAQAAAAAAQGLISEKHSSTADKALVDKAISEI